MWRVYRRLTFEDQKNNCVCPQGELLEHLRGLRKTIEDLRKEKEQLRKEKEQLRERELVLLRHQPLKLTSRRTGAAGGIVTEISFLMCGYSLCYVHPFM